MKMIYKTIRFPCVMSMKTTGPVLCMSSGVFSVQSSKVDWSDFGVKTLLFKSGVTVMTSKITCVITVNIHIITKRYTEGEDGWLITDIEDLSPVCSTGF